MYTLDFHLGTSDKPVSFRETEEQQQCGWCGVRTSQGRKGMHSVAQKAGDISLRMVVFMSGG